MNINSNVSIFEKVAKAELVDPTNLNGLPGMTSLEIAEITGKNHKHVLRDIAKMAEALGSRGPDLDRQIVSAKYLDSRGKTQPLVILDKRRTFVLLSRYSFELSDLIVGRWLELEGSGFARVSVAASVVHLVEREKDIRAASFRQIGRRTSRELSEYEKELKTYQRQADRANRKAHRDGHWRDLV